MLTLLSIVSFCMQQPAPLPQPLRLQGQLQQFASKRD